MMPELNLEVVDAPLLALATPERTVGEIVHPERHNLIVNPSFELDMTGWEPNQGGATTVVDDGWAEVGAKSCHITCAGAYAWWGLRQETAPGSFAAGETVTAEARFNLVALTGDSIAVGYHALNAAGAIIGQKWVARHSTTPGEFTLTNSYTLPAGTDHIRILLVANRATAMDLYVDAVILTREPLGGYGDGDAEHWVWDGYPHQSSSTRPERVEQVTVARDLLTLTTADDAPLGLEATEAPLLNLTMEAEPS